MHLHLASIDPRWASQVPLLQALVDALDHSLRGAACEAEVTPHPRLRLFPELFFGMYAA